MSDFPEKLYSVDPPNQSSDGLYMIVHTKKTDKCTVEYTRTPPTPPDEVCPVCGCTEWITTSLYGTECIHCLHKKGMPVEQVNIEAIAEKYTPEILGLMLMPSKEEYHKVRAILIRTAEEARKALGKEG
jgi:hypothetical protein